MLRTAQARVIALVAIVAAVVIVILCTCSPKETITVGFIYDNDETTPYSYDFYLAQQDLQKAYGDRINILMFSNVLDKDITETAEKLAERGCKIIFSNSYGNLLEFARKHPELQLCQVSSSPHEGEELPDNYHTFKGEAYRGRYVSGVVAGIKMRQMIDEGKLDKNKAQVGYVAAYPYPEVISGYTAFLLGVRSVVNTATLKVKYTNTWSDYTVEKAVATELLNEGCAVISQHTDTIGPAVACEEYYSRDVYHVGYNTDMRDVAPKTSLTSVRIVWTPYLVGAVEAVLSNGRIEDEVHGVVHEHNDMSGGISQGWVELTALNDAQMPRGAQAEIEKVTEQVENGKTQVFFGPYTGKNPLDPNDTVDLKYPFIENAYSSIPSFHYVLDNVVAIEE